MLSSLWLRGVGLHSVENTPVNTQHSVCSLFWTSFANDFVCSQLDSIIVKCEGSFPLNSLSHL